jgi:predicted nucleic acid-binding protein
VRYLLDTDIAGFWLRGSERARERVEAAIPEGIGLSLISLAELYEGVYLSSDQAASERHVENPIKGVALVSLGRDISAIFGRERARLRRLGNLIADLDILIAASALRHDLTLLTNNRRDFEGIEGLTIESV